jgi:hypothetical protein
VPSVSRDGSITPSPRLSHISAANCLAELSRSFVVHRRLRLDIEREQNTDQVSRARFD